MKVRPKFTVNRFRTDARGTERVLGKLESAVIELLWREPGLTVREVQFKLKRHRDFALTTVLTTLDRLHRKGYLSRVTEGKAFVYSPRYSRPEFDRLVLREVLSALMDEFKGAALSEFVDLVADDEEALERLLALGMRRARRP